MHMLTKRDLLYTLIKHLHVAFITTRSTCPTLGQEASSNQNTSSEAKIIVCDESKEGDVWFMS